MMEDNPDPDVQHGQVTIKDESHRPAHEQDPAESSQHPVAVADEGRSGTTRSSLPGVFGNRVQVRLQVQGLRVCALRLALGLGGTGAAAPPGTGALLLLRTLEPEGVPLADQSLQPAVLLLA